jgi:hypothetical protein
VTSRAPPPIVAPLVHDGVRYQPDASFTTELLPRRTTGLAAFDVATGAKLWSVSLWTIQDEPGAPHHPGRYLGRISPGLAPDDILVEDEHGLQFVVDRVRLTVRELPPAVDPTRIRR